MNNDLISRDYVVMVYNRVKEACKNCDNYNGVRCRACDIGDELLDLQDIIDNAPTVEPEKAKESDIIQAYTKGFDTGVETARTEADDELDQAIKIIKDVCRQHKNCVECPMNCNCNEHPAEWTETGGKT